ncbi:hypothetical protein [Micromonospora sp. SH-82]|uniref:hypothetical protein n=1 Tax=Micromonospora sp. SH-82 TaxID=3132938 RepID=UPI003EBCF33B
MPPHRQPLDDFLTRLEADLTSSEEARRGETGYHARTIDIAVADPGEAVETLTGVARQHHLAVGANLNSAENPLAATVDQLEGLRHGTVTDHRLGSAVDSRFAAEDPLRAALGAQNDAQVQMWQTVRVLPTTDPVSVGQLTKYTDEQVTLIRDLMARTREVLRDPAPESPPPPDQPQTPTADPMLLQFWAASADLHRASVRPGLVHAAGAAHRTHSANLDAVQELTRRQEQVDEKLTGFREFWLSRHAAHQQRPVAPTQTSTNSNPAPTYRAFHLPDRQPLGR